MLILALLLMGCENMMNGYIVAPKESDLEFSSVFWIPFLSLIPCALSLLTFVCVSMQCGLTPFLIAALH